jgi:hypothetical protein
MNGFKFLGTERTSGTTSFRNRVVGIVRPTLRRRTGVQSLERLPASGTWQNGRYSPASPRDALVQNFEKSPYVVDIFNVRFQLLNNDGFLGSVFGNIGGNIGGN